MTTPTTRQIVEALRDARNHALDEEERIPGQIEIREYAPNSVSVHATEWGDVVLLGRCVNIRGDGPDLDEQNRLVWSWAAGRMVGKHRESGTYRDLASAMRELVGRLPPRKR